MGILTRTVSLYYTYKFIRILVTPWEKLPAYEMGLIDANGKKVRSPKTSEEKDEYTFFHRLAFNIKRTINKVPLGKSMFASMATALYLLREKYNVSEEMAFETISENYKNFDIQTLQETYNNKKQLRNEEAPTMSTGPEIQMHDRPLAMIRRKKKQEQLRSFKEWSK